MVIKFQTWWYYHKVFIIYIYISSILLYQITGKIEVYNLMNTYVIWMKL